MPFKITRVITETRELADEVCDGTYRVEGYGGKSGQVVWEWLPADELTLVERAPD